MTTGLRVDWRWLVALLGICVLFIPARRYALPVTLPFELDPYRALLAGLLLAWVFSLLSDDRVRARASGLEGPLALFVVAVAGSLLANPERLSLYQGEVIRELSVLLSFLLTFYLAVGVLRRFDAVEVALGTLVLGGAVVAALSIIETRTGWSPFTNLERYIPILRPLPLEDALQRDGLLRAFGSAQHPIALGAMLALLAPIAVAFAVRRRSAIWWVALGFIVLGAMSTVSRTAVVMLVVSFVFFAALRWHEAKRFLPVVLAVVAFTHVLMPGAMGSLRVSLMPSNAIEEQHSSKDSETSAGRLADLGPSFREFSDKPILGYGQGTRIAVGEKANTRLLDNQWLGTLLDTGLVGVLALIWLFARFIGRLTRASANAPPRDAVLLVALASSALGYAVSMFFYDAFAFTQATLVFFLVLAAGCSLALAEGRIFDALPEPIVAPARDKRERLRARVAVATVRHRRRVGAQLQRVGRYSVRGKEPPQE